MGTGFSITRRQSSSGQLGEHVEEAEHCIASRWRRPKHDARDTGVRVALYELLVRRAGTYADLDFVRFAAGLGSGLAKGGEVPDDVVVTTPE
ncbi:MAG: hypothetical protein JRH01_16265 [Deltaproteobacteria bacterium]|nr:hypothetical protein [Deltaproteobacteria bacterium]MBW2401878.1 hypothetical protein [Deltaproteobacteria bacterium]